MKTLHRRKKAVLLFILVFLGLSLMAMGSARAQENHYGYGLVTRHLNSQSLSFTATSDVSFLNPMIIVLDVFNDVSERNIDGKLRVRISQQTQREVMALMWQSPWSSVAASPDNPDSNITYGVTPVRMGLSVRIWEDVRIIIYSAVLFSLLDPPYSYTVTVEYDLNPPDLPPFAQ